jgi:hypothetical protein
MRDEELVSFGWLPCVHAVLIAFEREFGADAENEAARLVLHCWELGNRRRADPTARGGTFHATPELSRSTAGPPASRRILWIAPSLGGDFVLTVDQRTPQRMYSVDLRLVEGRQDRYAHAFWLGAADRRPRHPEQRQLPPRRASRFRSRRSPLQELGAPDVGLGAAAVASLRAAAVDLAQVPVWVAAMLDEIDQMTTPEPLAMADERLGCRWMRDVRVDQLGPTVWFVEFDLVPSPNQRWSAWRVQVKVQQGEVLRAVVERCFQPLD